MLFAFPIEKAGAANTLGLEVADGRMSDEAPISDLVDNQKIFVKSKHRLGHNIDGVKERVTQNAAENGASAASTIVVG
jgi:hypothetical protein